MYLPFTSLNVGYINADNYKRRENKALFSKYFVGDVYLDQLLNPNIFYLVGEKGTGKTAYATFLSNNNYKEHNSTIFDVRQTEYQKFLELKKQGHLPLSEYAEVWRTLLLIAIATTILTDSGTPDFLKRFSKMKDLQSALDEFYGNAFAPELVKMISFIESSEVSTGLLAKYMGVSSNISSSSRASLNDSNTIFQMNLLKIRRACETAISSLKLEQHVLIFIDGIDVRPSAVEYDDYFECVQGLIEGIWALNTDYLANIKGSKGRIRVVLSVRPDTFLHTSIHNPNTKLRENSVFLNWMTSYKDYRQSLLFKIADHLLAAQQPTPKKPGESWDYYFPFHARNVKDASISDQAGVNSFLVFLRFSYYRPRDISSMINHIQEVVRRRDESAHYVTAEDFDDPSFRDAHANYLLGEVRDQLLFYYSQREYDLFLQFFSHLHGKTKFTYEDYTEAFYEYIAECQKSGKQLPRFFDSSYAFLQFLYEQNVICYKERSADEKSVGEAPFVRWCFRERALANMAPKVRTGVEYEIFYGLTKALNLGRKIKVARKATMRQIGTIITLEPQKGFGFLRGGEKQTEYYFRISDVEETRRRLKIAQKVSFEITEKHSKQRAVSIKFEA